MTELICVVCPKGCRLRYDEANGFAVSGNLCQRGEEYGRAELQNPTRVITSTVRVAGGTHSRCPVKTERPIPKDKIMDAMRLLGGLWLTAPVPEGHTVVEDICGTGICFITTRGIAPAEEGG
ncbi:MAG: DUF1667 domain-containing protein [Oscillospiraceae bacterium]|nr:DUF1667 domain-containing protein [Oscillospiraceae bacterium]